MTGSLRRHRSNRSTLGDLLLIGGRHGQQLALAG